jgi:hypothetical protein
VFCARYPGSQLQRAGNLIWLDYADLLIGGGRIRDLEDAQVTPVGLLGDYYRDCAIT